MQEREEKARRAARKKTDEPEDDGVEDLDLEEVENADEDDKEASPVEDDDQGVDTAEKEDGSDADEAGEQVAEVNQIENTCQRVKELSDFKEILLKITQLILV